MKYLVLTVVVSMIAARFAQAQYSFGPQVQSTNTAGITYNSGNGMFEYIAAANANADFAGLPLVGTAAAFITATNAWTASLTANLSARTIPAGSKDVYAGMGLYVIINNNNANTVRIAIIQENNAGTGGNGNFYGTTVVFEAVTNNQDLATTPLGGSGTRGGLSYRLLFGGTDASPASEPVAPVSGVLTLTNDASTGALTGYYNGSPVGSIPLDSWGHNPAMFVAVVGFSGYGVAVGAGTDTGGNFSAQPVVSLPVINLSQPQETADHANFSFLLSGPAGSGYVLQDSTNLLNWSPVITSTIPVGGSIVLSNSISGSNRRFYRADLQ